MLCKILYKRSLNLLARVTYTPLIYAQYISDKTLYWYTFKDERIILIASLVFSCSWPIFHVVLLLSLLIHLSFVLTFFVYEDLLEIGSSHVVLKPAFFFFFYIKKDCERERDTVKSIFSLSLSLSPLFLPPLSFSLSFFFLFYTVSTTYFIKVTSKRGIFSPFIAYHYNKVEWCT